MRQGQHRRPSEPLKERLVKLFVAPAAEQGDTQSVDPAAEDAQPTTRGRHAARAHDTAA